MYFRTLAIMILVISQVSFAQARKPAVEDFVGIEMDQPLETPQGTEGLFNFEKDISKFKETKGQPLNSAKTDTSVKTDEPTSLTTIIALTFILGLPILIWFLMMHHLRQRAHVESASNIQVLEKYRKQRAESRKAADEYKKAS